MIVLRSVALILFVLITGHYLRADDPASDERRVLGGNVCHYGTFSSSIVNGRFGNTT